MKMKIKGIFIVLFLFLSIDTYGSLIKNDFRVNDDSLNGKFYFTTIEMFENGSFCALWTDQRNGVSNIYAQMFDSSGLPSGQNFKVTTFNAITNEFLHSTYVFNDTLIDVQRGRSAQMLDPDGNRIDTTFYLQNSFPSNYNLVVKNREIYVTWSKIVSGYGYDVFLQKYNFQGDSISSTVKINDDVTNANQTHPEIAIGNSGEVLIVWEDYRNGNYDIYAQLLDSLLSPIGNNFIVCDSLDAMQMAPACVMDTAGNFVIFWQDNRSGNGDIYGQRFAYDGSKIGTNFIVNENGNSSYQSYPRCAMDKNRNIFVSWQDGRNTYYDIYYQKYDSTCNAVGGNVKVSESITSSSLINSDIACNENQIVFAWQDNGDSTYIYCRLFDNMGTPLTSTMMINDTRGIFNQNYPKLAMNNQNRAIIIWQDDRIYNGIYYQITDSLGNKQGDNKYLDIGYYPEIAENDNYAIPVYIPTDRKKVFYRFLNINGDTLTGTLKASSDSTSNKYYPSISINSLNSHVIAWYDDRNGNYDIYMSYFDSLDTPILLDSKVNDDAGANYQSDPSTAIREDGEVLVVWTDDRSGNYDIYGQLYDNNGNKISGNFLINDDGTTSGQYSACARVLSNGNFIVVWQDYRITSSIFAQLIDSIGTLIDSNIRISDYYSWIPDLSPAPNGKFVVTWFGYTDTYQTDYDILAREYNNDLTPLDTAVIINNPPEGLNEYQRYPTVATNGNVILFAWEDARWQKGYDIAANVYTWNLQGMIPSVPTYNLRMNLKRTISNGNLDIEYILPYDAFVDLSIFDISGKKVALIVKGSKTKGYHHVKWSFPYNKGKSIHKGIYFCKLNVSGNSLTKKILIY